MDREDCTFDVFSSMAVGVTDYNYVVSEYTSYFLLGFTSNDIILVISNELRL